MLVKMTRDISGTRQRISRVIIHFCTRSGLPVGPASAVRVRAYAQLLLSVCEYSWLGRRGQVRHHQRGPIVRHWKCHSHSAAAVHIHIACPESLSLSLNVSTAQQWHWSARKTRLDLIPPQSPLSVPPAWFFFFFSILFISSAADCSQTRIHTRRRQAGKLFKSFVAH